MMSYYSIISISSHSHLGERFNIGLICIDGNQAFFHFSERKVKIISKLFTKNSEHLVKSTMNSIIKSVEDFNFENKNNTELWEPYKEVEKLSLSYFNYLSRYNNNLIQFTAPKELDLDIDRPIFENLFQKYIYSDEEFNISQQNQVSDFDTFYAAFLSKARKYVNTNFKVTKDHISGLITPKKVDMIGKNGSFNLAHSVDFSTTFQTLNHHLDSFMYLALSSELAEDKKATCFLIGEEPKKDSKNHKIWQSARELKEVEYIPFDERDRIIEHFRKEGVSPIVETSSGNLAK